MIGSTAGSADRRHSCRVSRGKCPKGNDLD
jgi:hypothetical protein